MADSGRKLQCRAEGTHCVVLVSGRITIDSSPALRAELLRVLESQSCQSLTVDLQEVSYVDTSGSPFSWRCYKVRVLPVRPFNSTNLQQRPRYLFQAIGLLHFFDKANPEGGEPLHAPGPNS